MVLRVIQIVATIAGLAYFIAVATTFTYLYIQYDMERGAD